MVSKLCFSKYNQLFDFCHTHIYVYIETLLCMLSTNLLVCPPLCACVRIDCLLMQIKGAFNYVYMSTIKKLIEEKNCYA